MHARSIIFTFLSCVPNYFVRILSYGYLFSDIVGRPYCENPNNEGISVHRSFRDRNFRMGRKAGRSFMVLLYVFIILKRMTVVRIFLPLRSIFNTSSTHG